MSAISANAAQIGMVDGLLAMRANQRLGISHAGAPADADCASAALRTNRVRKNTCPTITANTLRILILAFAAQQATLAGKTIIRIVNFFIAFRANAKFRFICHGDPLMFEDENFLDGYNTWNIVRSADKDRTPHDIFGTKRTAAWIQSCNRSTLRTADKFDKIFQA